MCLRVSIYVCVCLCVSVHVSASLCVPVRVSVCVCVSVCAQSMSGMGRNCGLADRTGTHGVTAALRTDHVRTRKRTGTVAATDRTEHACKARVGLNEHPPPTKLNFRSSAVDSRPLRPQGQC